MTVQLLDPFARTPAPENSVWYMGHLFSFLADATDTRGQFSAMEIMVWRGGATAVHGHSAGGEGFLRLGGRVGVPVGGQAAGTSTGAPVVLPNEAPPRV